MQASVKGWALLGLAFSSIGVSFGGWQVSRALLKAVCLTELLLVAAAGDIATSPLCMQQLPRKLPGSTLGLTPSAADTYTSVFRGPPERADVMGALCLIFWTLTLVGVVKYCGIVLYANDANEGKCASCVQVSFALLSALNWFPCRRHHQPVLPPVQRVPRGVLVSHARVRERPEQGLAHAPLPAAQTGYSRPPCRRQLAAQEARGESAAESVCSRSWRQVE